jgi:hypothetical protein
MKEASFLVVANTDRGRELRIPLASSRRFTLSYIHSIYLAPAAEDFEVGERNEIVLKGVSTQSAAVAQYYGFEDGREYYPLHRSMKSFSVRVGMTNPQTVDLAGRKVSLGQLGEPGERLEFRVESLSRARIWFSRFMRLVTANAGEGRRS